MNHSTPGLPVHHQLPEPTQTHVHWVSDAIQPSHPLLSPSPPAFNLSQHQGLFRWQSSSHQVAKVLGVSASQSVLPMNIQDWFPLGWTGWISLLFKGLSRVFSSTTVENTLKRTSKIILHMYCIEKRCYLEGTSFVVLWVSSNTSVITGLWRRNSIISPISIGAEMQG